MKPSNSIPVTVLGSAILLSALSAQASPRFTVINDSDTKVNVYIYTGGDSVCSIEEKLKTVSAGETDSLGCTGNGKGQCKVSLMAKGDDICKSDRNTCNKNAIKVGGKSKLTITKTDDAEFACTLSKN